MPRDHRRHGRHFGDFSHDYSGEPFRFSGEGGEAVRSTHETINPPPPTSSRLPAQSKYYVPIKEVSQAQRYNLNITKPPLPVPKDDGYTPFTKEISQAQRYNFKITKPPSPVPKDDGYTPFPKTEKEKKDRKEKGKREKEKKEKKRTERKSKKS